MIPDFRITADGSDVTGHIAKNLASLTLTDKTGMEADTVEIVITDKTGSIALPRRGVVLRVSMGFKESGLIDKGSFTVDEVGEDGPVDCITILARSADFRSSLKNSRDASYNSTTLGAILNTVAERNGLTPAIHDDLAAVPIIHQDQTNESDANLVTRLADDFGAIATIKSGRLIFVPSGTGLTASGQLLPAVSISRKDGDRHSFRATDRDGTYTGVQAKWHDLGSARTCTVLAGKEGSTRVLKRVYPDQATAQAAADAAWDRQKNHSHSMNISLALGRPEIGACSPLSLSGWRNEITALSWLTDEVAHRLDGSGGLTSDIQASERMSAD